VNKQRYRGLLPDHPELEVAAGDRLLPMISHLSDYIPMTWRLTTIMKLILSILLAICQAMPATGQRLSDAGMIDYLVQRICLDEEGKPTRALPIEAVCLHSRPQLSDDAATYRKHDWPNALGVPEIALGYQASDSVVQRRGGRTLFVQTFDFGNAPRVFGRFDGGKGDGGQVAVLVGAWSSYAMTEDGDGGVQWFIGEACMSAPRSDRRFFSWAIFRNDASEDAWASIVASLNITSKADICPVNLNAAFTRYRLDRVDFPFRIIADPPGAVRTLEHALEVVVSEHFGGASIKAADHLERFYLAKGLGLVRWERWSNSAVAHDPGARVSATILAQTARCPKLDRYGAPDRGWILVDCRTWTTLVAQRHHWSVNDYNWPALAQFGEAN